MELKRRYIFLKRMALDLNIFLKKKWIKILKFLTNQKKEKNMIQLQILIKISKNL